MKFFIFALLLSSFYLTSAQTYYVSSSQGEDSNPGTSSSAPWKTLSKVNSTKFQPGDQILFKSGDEWAENEGININYSGTANNRIVFGSYGNGTKPEISMAYKLTGNWVDQGNNIWRLDNSIISSSAKKLWLNSISVKQVGYDGEVYGDQTTGSLATTANITSPSQVETLNSEYRFKIGSGFILLYSTLNPNTSYSSIETLLSVNAITLDKADYVTIKDLKITKCYLGIAVQGSKDVVLDNVDIYDVEYFAVRAMRNGNSKSSYLEIMNCNFNSGLGNMEGTPYEYYWGRGNFGINFQGGVDFSKVHNNRVVNFQHSGILAMATEPTVDSATINYNEFYDNIIDFTGVNWGRAFQLSGTSSQCHDNRYYRNKIIHQNIYCELSGYHNYFYYNIFVDDTLRGYYLEGERSILTWLGLGGDNHDNYFFNNTIYNCSGQLVLDWGQRNNMFNNLIINYNKAQKWNLPVIELKGSVGNTIYQNNFFYSPYIDHNSNEIRYHTDWFGTILSWNSAGINGDLIEGNKVLNSNPIIKDGTYGLKEPLYGVDITPFILNDFTKDINGNTINKSTPYVGAIENHIEPTGFKVYLEGPYKGGQMATTLNDNGDIPVSQPYNISPWNYSGNESVSSIPAGVVDWVLVELRSDTSVSTIVSRRAAFIKSDGTIVDLDGVSKVNLNVNAGNYYVVIYHRNHLAVMSANKVSLSATSFLYDFTTSSGKYYGNEAADLGDGKFGMFAGDGDANGKVNVLDYGSVTNNLFQSGYNMGDLDMQGTITVVDYGEIYMNLLRFSKVPR